MRLPQRLPVMENSVENAVQEVTTFGSGQVAGSFVKENFHVDNFILQSDLELMVQSFRLAKYSTCLLTSQIIIDFVWEKLNTGYWKDVNDRWRNIYYTASYYKSMCQIKLGVDLPECVKTCDLGILMGIKPSEWRFCLKELAMSLSKSYTTDNESLEPEFDEPISKLAKLSDGDLPEIADECAIARVQCPSVQNFQHQWLSTGSPVILTGCMNHWPALHKWNLSYIKEVAGMRTVPVEIGSRYTDADWSQQLVTVSQFIDQYIVNNGMDSSNGEPKKGYLAQHQLFDQVPELMGDICIPEYCCLGDNPDPDINAWFGPKGTISPLHQDPKSNLLCQVKGKKYVKLCHVDMTGFLYPNDGMLSNTSQIDAENMDLSSFPLSSKARFTEAVLNPGEMLFIPSKHWHYIRSLDTSFSVSFWWQ